MTEALTPERILQVAEEHIRVLGPKQLTMVSCARKLDVSHTALYRHFKNKAALLQAIVDNWLNSVTPYLHNIAHAETISAETRLTNWFHEARRRKLERITSDPQLFAAYQEIADIVAPVVRAHICDMLAQIQTIIEAGQASEEFHSTSPPREIAETLWWATSRFHNPKVLATDPSTEEELGRVLAMLLPALTTARTPIS